MNKYEGTNFCRSLNVKAAAWRFRVLGNRGEISLNYKHSRDGGLWLLIDFISDKAKKLKKMNSQKTAKERF